VAWTDVAFFAERGVPAANFGPGDPLLAHRADEFVTKTQIVRTYEVLDRVLTNIGGATRPWPATAGATP
jgi:succinyl-diaminopimelate desuccinylase